MKPFKFESVTDFDTHIKSSIPTFDELNYIVSRLAYDFAQPATTVVDVGCSTGRFLRSIEKREGVDYLGIEKTMKPHPAEDVEFLEDDVLRVKLPPASVVTSLFTMQFMPYWRRQDFLYNVAWSLVDGGIFVCAEKMHMESPALETVLQSNLLEWKRQNFTDTEIVEKAIGLKSVMYCQKQSDLKADLERNIGPTDCVWQWGQFGCFVSRKVKC